jgi:hypothetical protein
MDGRALCKTKEVLTRPILVTNRAACNIGVEILSSHSLTIDPPGIGGQGSINSL